MWADTQGGDREDAAERKRALEEAEDEEEIESSVRGGAFSLADDDSTVGLDGAVFPDGGFASDDDPDGGDEDEDGDAAAGDDDDARRGLADGGGWALEDGSALEEHVRQRRKTALRASVSTPLDKVDLDRDGRVSAQDVRFCRAFDLDADGQLDEETLERVRDAQRRNYPAEFGDGFPGWDELEDVIWNAGGDAALAAMREAFAREPLAGDAALAGRAATASLMAAAQAGELGLVRWLAAEAGANAEARNQRGQTPLLMAAEFGQWHVVAALKAELGADVEAHDDEYHTAMSMGMRRPAESLRALLEAGAKMSRKYFATALGESLDANRFELAGFLYGYHHGTLGARDYMRRLFRLGKGYRQEKVFKGPLFFDAVKAGWRLNPRPLAGALKLSGLFREMAGAGDASERRLYEHYAAYFEDRSVWLLEFVRSDVQLSLLLEHRPRSGVDGTPLDLALEHRCFQFVTHPRLTRVVHGWWRPFPLTTASLLRSPGELFRTPQVKFVMDCASFLCFLALFFAFSAQHKALADPVTLFEQVLLLFGLSYVVNEMQQAYSAGFGSYFQSGWNVADSLISGCVFVVSACRGFTWPDAWHDVVNVVYIGAVVLGLLAFTVRSLFLLADIPALGPLLLSLQKMRSDVLLFALLQLVTLAGAFVAFDFVINGDPALEEHPEGYETTGQMLLTLFQGGLAGEPSVDFQTLSPTRRVYAELLSCLHLLINGIVLVNLLIAVMSSTFDSVKNRSDEEFLFSRVRVRWDYDQSLNDLPPPFNLLVMLVFAVTWPFYRAYNYCFPQTWYAPLPRRRHGGGAGGGGGGGGARPGYGSVKKRHAPAAVSGGLRGRAVDADADADADVSVMASSSSAIALAPLPEANRDRSHSAGGPPQSLQAKTKRRNLPWQYCFYCHRQWTYGHSAPDTVSWTATERFPQLGAFMYRRRSYASPEHRQVNRLFRSGAVCSCVRLRKTIKGDRYYYERLSVVAFTVLLWVPVVVVYSAALSLADGAAYVMRCCRRADDAQVEDDHDALFAATLGPGARAGVGLRAGSTEDQLAAFKNIRVPEPEDAPISRMQAAAIEDNDH